LLVIYSKILAHYRCIYNPKKLGQDKHKGNKGNMADMVDNTAYNGNDGVFLDQKFELLI